MHNLSKIFLVSILFLQIFSYLHLAEHGHGGEHENEQHCEIIFQINNFAGDSVDAEFLVLQDYQYTPYFFTLVESENSSDVLGSYFSRAPPVIS